MLLFIVRDLREYDDEPKRRPRGTPGPSGSKGTDRNPLA
jgi:hypothetical protein